MEKIKKVFKAIDDSAIFSIIVTLFIFAISSLVILPIDRCLTAAAPSTEFWAMSIPYAEFIGIWITFLIAMAISKKYRPFLSKLGPKSGNTWKNILLGALLGFGTNTFCVLMAVLTKKIFLSPADAKPIGELLLLLFFVLIQSSAEELVCRLFLYQRIKRTYPDGILATIISALFFSILHIYNDGVTTLALVSIAVIGIQYALIIYYFDAFWMCAFAHALWNYTQNIIFGLPNSGAVSTYSIFVLDASAEKNSFFYHNEFGVESTGMAVAVNILIIVIVVYFGQKKKKKEAAALENQTEVQM